MQKSVYFYLYLCKNVYVFCIKTVVTLKYDVYSSTVHNYYK